MPQRARNISCACLNSAALMTDFSIKDFLGHHREVSSVTLLEREGIYSSSLSKMVVS